NTWRERLLFEFFHFCQYALLRIERVGIGHLENGQEDSLAAVHARGDVLVFRPELHTRYILETDDASILSTFQDNVLKLLWIGEPAQGVECDLRFLVPADRFLANGAGGKRCILFAQGVNDVGSGQLAHRQPIGIDPDAHAVVALAEEEDIADPGNSRNLVANLHEREVAEVKLIVTAIGRVDGNAAEN